MINYFRTDGAPDDGADEPLDSAALSAWLRGIAAAHDPADLTPDTLDDLRAWAMRGPR
jgi:hypothetical protein